MRQALSIFLLIGPPVAWANDHCDVVNVKLPPQKIVIQQADTQVVRAGHFLHRQHVGIAPAPLMTVPYTYPAAMSMPSYAVTAPYLLIQQPAAYTVAPFTAPVGLTQRPQALTAGDPALQTLTKAVDLLTNIVERHTTTLENHEARLRAMQQRLDALVPQKLEMKKAQ